MIAVASMSSLALPEELWLATLVLLPYSTLRTVVARLNKSFQAMLTLRPLAETTFVADADEDKVRAFLARGGRPDAHPVFARLSWFPESTYADIKIASGGRRLVHPVARGEKATSPAVTSLTLSIPACHGLDARRTLSNPKGVKVSHVVQNICLVLSTEVCYCDDCDEYHAWEEIAPDGLPEILPCDVALWGEEAKPNIAVVYRAKKDGKILLDVNVLST